MPSFDFSFHRLSFWLGFIAATLFWWIITRVRPMLPLFREQLRRYFSLLSQRNFTAVENYLCREVLRTAQRQHAASPLFALDDILVAPWLLSPPADQDPNLQPIATSIAAQVVPYLPDWPELAAPYGVPLVSPASALQSGRNLLLIGRPGCGKTVALSHLASQLCRREDVLGSSAQAVPLLLHVLDLDLVVQEGRAAYEHVLKAVASGAAPFMQTQIQRFLRAVILEKQRRLVLLLDGLDELPASEMAAASAFLSALIQQTPGVQVVAAASDEFIDELTGVGFYPLAVAAWGQRERVEFAKGWGERWNTLLLPEIKKQVPTATIEPALLDFWLCSENDPATPLEWTLRVWGAYAGDLRGNSVGNALDAHISRFLPSPSLKPALETLAHQMIKNATWSSSFDAMEKVLSSVRIDGGQNPALQPTEGPQLAGLVEAAQAASAQKNGAKKKTRQNHFYSQGERIIEGLLQGGILVEHTNHQIRFSNPVFLGFLASKITTAIEAEELSKTLQWPASAASLQYAVTGDEDTGWVSTFINRSQPPFYHELFTAARWLRDAPTGAAWRSAAMRALAALAQNEAVPLGIRARAVAAFYVSRDPFTVQLFRQLTGSKSPALRRAALLGFGAVGSPQLINDALALLTDPHPEVRCAACMALASIPVEPARKAVVEVLLNGDELLRQAAAEALAMDGYEGHKVLQEAAAVEDLLTRRAAVYGLVQVRQPWAKKLLEKTAIEDGQWIVRNAAAQALDTYLQSAPAVPPPVPPPADTSWIITFASKMGLGILPGQPATDVLLAVLKSGTVEEQIAALNWLREQHQENAILAIYELLYGREERLVEPALHALWWMDISGVSLPAPIQTGSV